MISSHRILTQTIYLYRGYSASTSFGKLLLGFSWGSDNAMASNKNSTSKKGPSSAPEITI